MIKTKQFPIIILSLTILSLFLVYMVYLNRSVILLGIISLIHIVVASLSLTVFSALKNNNKETENQFINMTENISDEIELIKSTTTISEYVWDVLNKEISILKKYGVKFSIKYNIVAHKYYIEAVCPMSTYTRMAVSDDLSDIVMYKIKDSDIVLYKNKNNGRQA